MKIKDIATGNITKKQLMVIMLPGISLMVTFWTIARSFYPLGDGYYIDERHISRQGDLLQNPVGGWFFIISTIIAGLCVIIFTIFVFRRLWKTFWPFTILFLLSGIAGGLGFIFVGMSPEGIYHILDKTHKLGSEMAFIGLGIAAFLSLFLMFIRLFLKKSWPTPVQFFTLLILIAQFAAMLFFIQSSSIIQWTGFYTIFVWLLGMLLILPNELPEPLK